jgi:hypothetical protein
MSLHRALFVFTPAESKRLLAKAVAALPEVQHARTHGRLIIGNGTTNAFIAQELLGEDFSPWRFSAGVIAGGALAVTDGATRLPPVALKAGQPFAEGWVALLQEFEEHDVFIKGGNAVDPEGNVGALYGIMAARGARLIAPVGLEKLVPDVLAACFHCGTTTFAYADGLPVGMGLLPGAEAVTELDALELLCGVEAYHVASGGLDGSEGAVTIVVEGPPEAVAEAVALSEAIAGEPPIGRA